MGKSKKETQKEFEEKISKNALKNLDEITGYIAFVQKQPLNAIKVGDRFFKTFDRIKSSPFAFRECSELPTKKKIYRSASCSSWNVIFRIGEPVLILGIIHQSRRPSAVKKFSKIK